MDLSVLRIFAAIVQEGGVTNAARRVGRVQSNVSTRIRQLEEGLAVKLFVRDGRRLHLSAAGEQLFEYAPRLLSLAEEARMAVQDKRPRGVLRLGAMESTAAVRLPSRLKEYHRRYPEVTIELRIGNPRVLGAAILAGNLDAAIVAEPVASEPFEKVAVFREEMVILSRAERTAGRRKPLSTRVMLAFEHGCPHRKRLEAWYQRRGEMPERIVELGSYHAMLGCISAGMGIALLPKSVLSTFPEAQSLQVHKLPPHERVVDTVMIWRNGTSSPKVEALRQLLTKRRPT